MKEEYKKALAEVGQILEYTDDEIMDRIPDKFIEYVEENMDKKHRIELDQNKDLLHQNIMLETKQILALIYRDYILSEEERKQLLKDEFENRKRVEEEKREKYEINFNKRTYEKIQNEPIEEKALIAVQEQKWYKKIINKILSLFKLKK